MRFQAIQNVGSEEIPDIIIPEIRKALKQMKNIKVPDKNNYPSRVNAFFFKLCFTQIMIYFIIDMSNKLHTNFRPYSTLV